MLLVARCKAWTPCCGACQIAPASNCPWRIDLDHKRSRLNRLSSSIHHMAARLVVIPPWQRAGNTNPMAGVSQERRDKVWLGVGLGVSSAGRGGVGHQSKKARDLELCHVGTKILPLSAPGVCWLEVASEVSRLRRVRRIEMARSLRFITEPWARLITEDGRHDSGPLSGASRGVGRGGARVDQLT